MEREERGGTVFLGISGGSRGSGVGGHFVGVGLAWLMGLVAWWLGWLVGKERGLVKTGLRLSSNVGLN